MELYQLPLAKNNLRYKKTIYFGQLTKNKGGKMSFLNKFPKKKAEKITACIVSCGSLAK